MMTRSDMPDPSKTGEDAPFDLARMSSQEVAAELLRRHQAMRARAAMKRDPAEADATLDLVDIVPKTVIPPKVAPANVVPAVAAPDAAPMAVVADNILSRPMAEPRASFGAIARLAAEHPTAPGAAASTKAGTGLAPSKPTIPDQPTTPAPAMPPAPADLPLRSLRAVGDLAGPAPMVPPSLSPIRRVAASPTGKNRFAAGFGWGVVTGAAAMVVLLAVEIALFPSLHLPARLHQLRGMIDPAAIGSDAPASATSAKDASARDIPAPTDPARVVTTATLPSPAGMPPAPPLPTMPVAAAPLVEQLPLETPSLVPAMERPQPRLLSTMPTAAAAAADTNTPVITQPAVNTAASPAPTSGKPSKTAVTKATKAASPTGTAASIPVPNRTKPRPVDPALAGGAKL